MNQNLILESIDVRFWEMAGSKPGLMVAIMPTALFFTADATSASCRIIVWVLNPWRHQWMCTYRSIMHLTKIVGDLVAKLNRL